MQVTDETADRNIIEAGQDYIYFQRTGDWTDADYVPVMQQIIEETGADMIVCGVLRVRGENFKRGDFYEEAEILEGQQRKWKLLRDGYLRYGLCGCFMKKAVYEKITGCSEKELVFAALKEAAKIGILNDYKYYYRENAEKGFYEETVKKPVKFSALLKRCEIYQKFFPEFSDMQLKGLFSRKEWLLLTYRKVGRIFSNTVCMIQERLPRLYRIGNETADKLIKVLRKKDTGLLRNMKENSGGQRVLILGTPEYHNLGDHAIAYAQKCFVEYFFPGKPVICVTEDEIQGQFHTLKKYITERDILLLQGGGNMGDAYRSIENLRLKIVRSFPGNRIAVMPQTIHFSDKPEADKLKMRMKHIYTRHKHLLLNAREYTSYERMKDCFPGCSINLCPDIVMSLNIQTEITQHKREGILLLLRTDAEGTLDVGQLMRLKELCRELDGKTGMAETSLSYGISQKERREALYAKWNQIAGVKLVVTDRLHGMIFAAITGTPCIVLANFNHKVEQSYEWLRELGYIWFCKEFSQMEEQLGAVWPKLQEQYRYENSQIWKYYEGMADKIKNL